MTAERDAKVSAKGAAGWAASERRLRWRDQALAERGRGRAGSSHAWQFGLRARGFGGRTACQRWRRRHDQALAEGGYGRAGSPPAWLVAGGAAGRAAGQRRPGREDQALACRRAKAARCPLSSRRPQFYERRMGQARGLRHAVAAELPSLRTPLKLADAN